MRFAAHHAGRATRERVASSIENSTRQKEVTMTHEQFQSCISACDACALACGHCAGSCLAEDGVADMTRCIKLDIDCAAACHFASAAMARGSSEAATICRMCADICDACAAECEKHEAQHCKDCAASFRACAKACRAMAS
jgi:hypothetical protein